MTTSRWPLVIRLIRGLSVLTVVGGLVAYVISRSLVFDDAGGVGFVPPVGALFTVLPIMLLVGLSWPSRAVAPKKRVLRTGLSILSAFTIWLCGAWLLLPLPPVGVLLVVGGVLSLPGLHHLSAATPVRQEPVPPATAT